MSPGRRESRRTRRRTGLILVAGLVSASVVVTGATVASGHTDPVAALSSLRPEPGEGLGPFPAPRQLPTLGPRAPRGAAVLAEPGGGSVASLRGVDWFLPSVENVAGDRPDGYRDECSVAQVDTELHSCVWGDPDGDVTVAVVGDSKMLQWQTPLEAIAAEQGWRIVTHLKSACGFHAGTQVRDGGAYTQCVAWNKAVRADLVEMEPDLVITSQRQETALADPQEPASESRSTMVEAIASTWSLMERNDIPVVVLLDNPSPRGGLLDCVAEHPAELQRCAFDREEAVVSSSALVQKAAARRVEGVTVVDMTDTLCPEESCPPVIGNVLLYRAGSHLGDTYLRSLQPQLAARLVPAVESVLD